MRNVFVQLTVPLLMEFSDDMTDEDIEFFLNESSHCSSNELESAAVSVSSEHGTGCGCLVTEFKVLSEPTSAIDIRALSRWRPHSDSTD